MHDHERLFDTLDKMLNEAPFLSTQENPAVVSLKKSRNVGRAGAAVLTQYSFLPEVITEFLCRGVVQLYEWPAVRDELLRNLGEELGSKTDGWSHLAILRNCFNDEVKIDLFGELNRAEETQIMIEEIRELISKNDKHTTAGAIYALEASATPELKVVGRLINQYALAVHGGAIVSEDYSMEKAHDETKWNLDRFLAVHVFDFEKGHRDNFREAIEPHLKAERDGSKFEAGFDGVMRSMATWWDKLGRLAMPQ